jgi:hypothetical protein
MKQHQRAVDSFDEQEVEAKPTEKEEQHLLLAVPLAQGFQPGKEGSVPSLLFRGYGRDLNPSLIFGLGRDGRAVVHADCCIVSSSGIATKSEDATPQPLAAIFPGAHMAPDEGDVMDPLSLLKSDHRRGGAEAFKNAA